MSDITKTIKTHLENHSKVDLIYPNRFKEIHKVACEKCPSVYYRENNISDPEVEDIKNYTREEQIKTVFPCGWRNSKLCKGYCDDFNINENDLK
jgi:hypothetical protein